MSEQRDTPDLLDSRGRMRRLVLAFVLGVVVAAAAYTALTQLAEPDKQVTTGGYRFVWYFTALAGGGVFVIALAIQNRIAKKQYRESLDPPPARTVRD